MNLPDRWSTPVWESGHWTGSYFNVPAFVIIFILTVLLVRGVRESAEANNVMVAIKIGAILIFLMVGGALVNPSNWRPFAPSGFGGIVTGGAIVFFTYIGFDSVSTAAEEARNPQRDLPIGIIGSLIVCTVLYIGVSIVLLGMMKYTTFVSGDAAQAPVAYALQMLGANRWSRSIIVIGALTGMISSLLVFQYGQARIWYAMSRDGLFPKLFSKVHPRFKTPHLSTWVAGFAVGVPAGIFRHQRRRRPLEHRHALRFRAGLAGSHHPQADATRSQARLQSALRALVPADLDPTVRRAHDRTHRHHLAALRDLAGARPRDLHLLQPPSQRVLQETIACRRRRSGVTIVNSHWAEL